VPNSASSPTSDCALVRRFASSPGDYTQFATAFRPRPGFRAALPLLSSKSCESQVLPDEDRCHTSRLGDLKAGCLTVERVFLAFANNLRVGLIIASWTATIVQT
jgi:hypothetical protein